MNSSISSLPSTSEFDFRSSPARFFINPVARPANIVQGDKWRITVLTAGLVRLEYSDGGVFEDEASLTATNRDLGEVKFSTSHNQHGELVIETERLRLTYNEKLFSAEGLSVVVKGVPDSQFNTWHYADADKGNLKATARTLDEADGEIPLEDGVISRDGWAVLDDSSTNLLVRRPANPFGYWIEPRQKEEIDLYFFGYGLDFIQAVVDFQRLSGKPPVVPRYALGNWWSRFHRYSEQEYSELMDRFEHEGVPLSVSVIDMDWHITDIDPQYGSGWTGYTWNRELFPDPQRFLGNLQKRGLVPSVNLHPRDGIRAFEESYAKLAQDMGIDSASGTPVEFDPTDPAFMSNYFRDVLRPMEKDGVRFWWMDWQQGSVTRQKGLDPLWSLNHLHFLESVGPQNSNWPIIFSRFAGPGSQRYPVGFSGDTSVTWASLKFQPYFTLTASNIAYGWWSHDIGGHMHGARDNELETRWYQFGTFSPINRLHSSSSQFNTKEPWNFPQPYCSAMKETLRLRNRLVPYLYSMDWRAAEEGRPLVEPLYWQEPRRQEAYLARNEYRFGTELLVAPITDPLDPVVQRARTEVYLPQGEWFDFFTGRRYVSQHGRMLPVWRDIAHIPVFARAGAIIPLQDANQANDENPEHITVLLFPDSQGGVHTFNLIEDDGKFPVVTPDGSLDKAHRVVTTISVDWSARKVTVKVPEGNTSAIPAQRRFSFIIRGVNAADETMSTVIDAPIGNAPFSLQIPGEIAPNPAMADIADLLRNVQMSFDEKDAGYSALQRDGLEGLTTLQTLSGFSDETKEAIAEIFLRS